MKTKENGITWSAIDLGNVSTDFIRDMLSRKGGPTEARTALIQELIHRETVETTDGNSHNPYYRNGIPWIQHVADKSRTRRIPDVLKRRPMES